MIARFRTTILTSLLMAQLAALHAVGAPPPKPNVVFTLDLVTQEHQMNAVRFKAAGPNLLLESEARSRQ